MRAVCGVVLVLVAVVVGVAAVPRELVPSDDVRVVVEPPVPLHHQKVANKGWVSVAPADPDHRLELLFAIKQTNTDLLERTLLDISDPTSRNYGQWLSFERVNAMVAPTADAKTTVLAWLRSHGVEPKLATPNGDFVSAVVTVAQAESLLHTTYHHYLHPAARTAITRLHVNASYSLPASVAPHVDFVAPTLTFPRMTAVRVVKGAGGRVTPEFLRSLYNVTEYGFGADSNNSQGIASFLEQYYDPTDLTKFWEKYGLPPVTFENVPSDQPHGQGIEAELDVQYITATGANISSQHWYTAGRQPGSDENEPFVKWLTAVASASDAPSLFSVSYGDDEDTVTPDYAQRSSVEFQKAGGRGITLMFASGDSGAGCSLSGAVPTFPAANPFVTAVGGTTDGHEGDFPTGEVVATLSGGGFSNYFARPSYQDEPVKLYLEHDMPRFHFNRSGAAFPDIAAQAQDFDVCVGGVFSGVSGTSAACPTAAGLLSLVNEYRVASGKAVLGYANPWIYQQAQLSGSTAFSDVTQGNNNYCDVPEGFPATKGWDAATGWGSPNYFALKAASLL